MLDEKLKTVAHEVIKKSIGIHNISADDMEAMTIMLVAWGISSNYPQTKDILHILYTTAGLDNNKKLTSRLHEAERCFNNDNIFTSAINDASLLVAEELIKNDTLKKLYIDLVIQKYPAIKKAMKEMIDKKVSSLHKLFNFEMNILLYGVCMLSDDYPERGKIVTYTMYEKIPSAIHPYSDDIYILDNGESIFETGLFEKYKEKRIGELCEYYKIDRNMLSSFIYNHMRCFTDAEGEMEYRETGYSIHKLTANLLYKHGGALAWLDSLYGEFEDKEYLKGYVGYRPNVEDVVDAYYNGLFVKCRLEDEMAGNNITRLAMMRYYKASPKEDLLNICYTYQIDRLIKLVMLLVEENYKKFTVGNEINAQKQYEYLITELNNVISENAKENKQYKKQIEEINRKIVSLNDKSFIPYEKKIKELEDKLAKQEEEINRLKQYNEDKDTYIKLLEQEDVEETEDINITVDIDVLREKKLLFVGGRYEVVRQLMKQLPNVKYVEKNTTIALDTYTIDNIVIFYDFLNHSMYTKAINLAREKDINVIYCSGSNQEKILQTIYKNMV